MLPEKGVLYAVRGIVIVQKLKGGYLVGVYSPDETEVYGLGFLRTNKKFEENENLSPYEFLAYYSGAFTYRAVNGYDRSVPSFKIYNGKKVDFPFKRYSGAE